MAKISRYGIYPFVGGFGGGKTRCQCRTGVVNNGNICKGKTYCIASNGIFDVVSNQEVIDRCFRHRDDPARACISLVDKSHKEWLLNDDCDEDEANYDDMTCICLFFQHPEHEVADVGATAPQSSSWQETTTRRHGKRVRQKTVENLDQSLCLNDVSS